MLQKPFLVEKISNFYTIYCNPLFSHLSLLNLIILMILLFTWKSEFRFPENFQIPNSYLLDLDILPHSSLQVLNHLHPSLVIYQTGYPAPLSKIDDSAENPSAGSKRKPLPSSSPETQPKVFDENVSPWLPPPFQLFQPCVCSPRGSTGSRS